MQWSMYEAQEAQPAQHHTDRHRRPRRSHRAVGRALVIVNAAWHNATQHTATPQRSSRNAQRYPFMRIHVLLPVHDPGYSCTARSGDHLLEKFIGQDQIFP